MPGRELILYPGRGRAERTAEQCLTLEALAVEVHLHPALVEQFVAYGLLEPIIGGDRVTWFDVRAVRRLRTICRLREDLGINLPGVAAVLDLLERIDRLQREVAHLRLARENHHEDFKRDQ